MRLTVEIDFPKDRKEYTDCDGRVWKLDDYKHWVQWVHWALTGTPDAAMYRCGAKVHVQNNPKPEPFRIRCYKCGELAEVRLQGACDALVPIRRYGPNSGADGFIVPDWDGAYAIDPRDGECEYICSECENKIFDNSEQIEDYMKVHGEDTERDD